MDTRELRTFLKSGSNAYTDKIKMIKKYATKRQLQDWAVKVAESILHVYDDKNPDDFRVGECIQATKDYLNGKIGIDELWSKRDAADYAAYAANAAAYAANAANAANAAARREQQKVNIQLMVETLEIRIPDNKISRAIYQGRIIRGEDGVLVV